MVAQTFLLTGMSEEEAVMALCSVLCPGQLLTVWALVF